MKNNIIAFTLALTLSSGVFADSSSEPVATTGLFTLSANQSVQIHLLNLDDKDCALDFNLLDNLGVKLNAGTKPLIIEGNSSESWVLPTTTTTTTTMSSSQAAEVTSIIIRAQLDFTPQLSKEFTLAGCGKLIPTLEIIEPSKSAVILNTNFYGMPNGDKSESYKVKLCHKPGTPAQKTLELASSAVNGHKSHGDTVGPCPNKSNDSDDNDNKGKNKK